MSPGEHDHPVNPGGVTAARAGVLSVDDAGRLAGLLGMLADPVRSRILFALSAAAELCVGDLALALDVTEDQVSYALKMLRLAGPGRPSARTAGWSATGSATGSRTGCWSTACASCWPSPRRTESADGRAGRGGSRARRSPGR